jgi:hypothetical protein
MHAEVEAQLKVLANLCPTVFLEDKEWETLYRVSLTIHTHGGLQDHQIVNRFLLDQGCSLHKAGFLSRQVLHLCTVLQKYDDHRTSSAKGVASKQDMTLLWSASSS